MTKTNKTDRREFLKKGLSLGLVAGGSLILGKADLLSAKDTPQGMPDLVAVKNGEPDVMFKKAIGLMGGMDKFVKKGQTVVIKPNIGFPRSPEAGATTNPLLVKAIVQHCYQAGAKKVYVFDNVVLPTSSNARNCYKLSGIEEAAKSAGALVVPADNFKYLEVKIPGAIKLKTTSVHELILNSDVFINVPVLKHHGSTQLSIAMKNLMGVVSNRMEYHLTGLDQCIADFCLFCKPNLNIVDAYRVLMSHGPSGPRDGSPPEIEVKKTLLMSRDIVAVDAAAAKIFGKNPENIKYIKLAHDKKIGNMNLAELKIVTYAL
ncbi:MAG: tat (twin-arginine translocation) pathway signal sequence [Deltaproteobacteria bacterium HGW-Deltaproteobacteria-10]|nr:MAG: tat (twin-arginine translocation) pathway signal sequence [Deltaproteobacteria bacterium HGW-Deltaproteobacteria-10]